MARPDKRTRLLHAANRLVHQQGFNQTTLAHIAKAADVPLGNVYYYFKTKEDIGQALIDQRSAFYRDQLAACEISLDPRLRIVALIDEVAGQRKALARSGCPIGTLCQELHKQGGPLAQRAAGPLADILKWAQRQFRLLGKGDESADLALHLLSALQGASLLAHAFNKSELVARETARLKQWVHAL